MSTYIIRIVLPFAIFLTTAFTSYAQADTLQNLIKLKAALQVKLKKLETSDKQLQALTTRLSKKVSKMEESVASLADSTRPNIPMALEKRKYITTARARLDSMQKQAIENQDTLASGKEIAQELNTQINELKRKKTAKRGH